MSQINKQTKELLIEKLAYPYVIFEHEMKWIKQEIKEISICKEYRHLDYATIAVSVVRNYIEMKKNITKGLESF